MHRKSHTVWLDLEQTIIDSWSSGELINVSPIRRFLQARNIQDVSIFSFAIYNEEDKQDFDTRLRPSIEEALGVKVMMYPSVQDMIREEKKFTGIAFNQAYEVAEYIQLRGKKDGFFNYIQGTCEFDLAILIDDTVPDISLWHRLNRWSIELWNVDTLIRFDSLRKTK